MSWLLPLVLLSCEQAPDYPLQVVVVVIDGIRTDEILLEDESELSGLTGPEHMPNLWSELVPQGTLLTGVRNMGATITAQGHASLLSGRRQILANMAADDGAYLYRSRYPTLAEELVRQDSRVGLMRDALLIANQELISPLNASLMPGYGQGVEWVFISDADEPDQPATGDLPAFKGLKRELRRDVTRLTVLNAKAVDRTGHYGMPGPADYLTAIGIADEEVAGLWSWLQGREEYVDNTVLVVVSDHGRHREGSTDEYWRNHSNSSEGDRAVPLLLLGPGIEAGQVVETPYALADVAPTLAELLGIELPWANGLPITEALVNAPTAVRSGQVQLAVAGGELITQELLDDPAHRSRIVHGEDALSSPDAWAAEAPVAVVWGDDVVACWRELIIGEAASPWVPRCQVLGGDAFDGPEPDVNPFWRPELRVVDGELWAVYIHNPEDLAATGIDEDVGARLARLNEDMEWEVFTDTVSEVRYPSHASGLVDAEGSVIVFSGTSYDNEARRNVRIWVQAGTWAEDGAYQPEPAAQIDLSAVAPEGEWRIEDPRLRGEGDDLELLALGFTEDSRQIIRAWTSDRGQSWDAEILFEDDAVASHLGPQWVDGTPTWTAQTGAGVFVSTPDGHALAGTPRVRDIAVDGGAVYLTAELAPGQWGVVEASLPEP